MTTLTGTLRDSGGNPITGSLWLELSQPGTFSPGSILVTPLQPSVFTLAAGVITGPGPGPYQVYGNDGITPSSTWYVLTAFDSSGQQVLRFNTRLTGASVDLGALPIAPTQNWTPPVDPSLTLAGDVSGPLGATVVGRIRGRSVAAPPWAPGDVLTVQGDGSLAFDTPSGIADGDKGDITVGGGGTTLTIDNDAVTYAKLQNVSATSRILGRASAGAGDVEELTGAQVLSIAGAAAASHSHTGLLSGLTSGYLPRASSATAVVDSPLYVDGENVGLGIEFPTDLLHLKTETPAKRAALFLEADILSGSYAAVKLGSVLTATEFLISSGYVGGAVGAGFSIRDTNAGEDRLTINNTTGDVSILRGLGVSGAASVGGDLSVVGTSQGRIRDKGGQVFNVLAYGAVPNAGYTLTAAITSGTAALTSATSVWDASDVGLPIKVVGAGPAGATLTTTIVAYVSGTSVTLAANASTTVTTGNAYWGTDCTAAFQAALNDAALVYGSALAPDGAYLLEGYVEIPPNTALRGTGMHRKIDERGSVLYLTANKGNASAQAQISVSDGATLAGVAITYPDRLLTNPPTAYPFAVRMGPYSTVKHCYFLYAYQAIDVEWTSWYGFSSAFTIEDVRGVFLHTGIAVDRCADFSHIKDIVGFAAATPGLVAYQKANAVLLRIGRADNIAVSNVKAIFHKTGVHLVSTASGRCYGTFSDVGFDLCENGFDIEATGYPGVIINGFLSGQDGSPAPRHAIVGRASAVTPTAADTAYVIVNGLEVWGNAETPVLWQNAGTLKINSGRFVEWYADTYAVDASRGSVSVQNSSFMAGYVGHSGTPTLSTKAIRFTSGVSRGVATGNDLNGRSISNAAVASTVADNLA